MSSPMTNYRTTSSDSSSSVPAWLVALGAVPFLVMTPLAKAVTVVRDGSTLNVDASAPQDAYAVIGAGSTLNAAGTSISFIDMSDGGTLNMTGGSIQSSNGVGLSMTGSKAVLNNVDVSSDEIGLSAGRELGAAGSSVQVTGGSIQGVQAGARVTGSSSLQLSNTRVSGTGTRSAGLQILGGDVLANNGTSITGAEHGVVIAADTPTEGGAYRLVLDNASATGNAGAAIQVKGGITGTVEVLNGSNLSGNNGNVLQVEGNATANMRVGSSALTGNVQVASGSSANVTFDQGQMTGDFVVADGGNGTLSLQNGSQLTGNLSNVADVTLGGLSTWNMVGSNTVQNLTLDNSTVNFGTSGEFYDLNVGKLSGNGRFNIGVDYATNQHDTLNVTDSATGSHTLLVEGSGVDPVSPEQLTVVRTASGDATFALADGRAVDVGTWSYGLGSVANGSGGTDWFLDPSQATISPGTSSVLALFNTAPTVWYGELTSLRSRMGELRFNGGKAGGWVRTYGNKYNVDGASGLGYQQTQQGFSLGADAPLPMGDGQWLVGVLAGHSKSDLDLSRGTSGTVKSEYAGVYTTWLDEASGYYVDGVLKLNQFRNDSKVSMSDGTRAKGNYKTLGLGGSVEFGRHIKLDDGYFVEPFTQLSAVAVRGKNYDLDNGMQAAGDRSRSLLGKVGATAGRNFTLDNGSVVQPYVRMAGVHEFVKKNEVRVNDNAFNNDLSGSRAELGAGVAVAFSSSLQLHADFDYANGKHVEQPFGANVGLRYSW